MYLYQDQFSQKHDYSKVAAPSKVLIIASTGRCGSHMLGHALHKTKKFGFPLEYANGANLTEWARRLGSNDFKNVMSEIQQRRTSPNGVFGIKLHYPHIKQFGGFAGVVKYFPDAYYILLSREDVLKQAVSLSIAAQTGVWISGQKPVKDNPEYNFSHINKCLRDTILNNSLWRYTLAASGCNYIEMNFDYVRYNLAQSIENIANFIDIDIDKSEIPTDQVTKKQSSKRNAEWAMRFSSEFNKSNQSMDIGELNFIKKFKEES